MPEPFKNNFSMPLVKSLAGMLAVPIPEFDADSFSCFVADEFESLELKQRSNRIAEGLCIYMPADLFVCSEAIQNILHPEDITEFSNTQSDQQGLRGWLVMPVAEFVSRRWVERDFLGGLLLLKQLTRRFSAEFAIRAFILTDTEQAMREITQWTQDANEHVRRLASEGTRPRLPWGQQLPMFMKDPEPLTPVLKALMDDDSEYVRRSVANNLNDIAKDNPDFVIDFVNEYLSDANDNRILLFRHACRSLFKQGNLRTLALFGYGPFEGDIKITQISEQVEWGGDLNIEIEIHSGTKDPKNLMLDYVIWHQKANGTQSPRVFKWKVIEGFQGTNSYKKRHSFKPVTTRKYYAGDHRLEIQINGAVLSGAGFKLLA